MSISIFADAFSPKIFQITGEIITLKKLFLWTARFSLTTKGRLLRKTNRFLPFSSLKRGKNARHLTVSRSAVMTLQRLKRKSALLQIVPTFQMPYRQAEGWIHMGFLIKEKTRSDCKSSCPNITQMKNTQIAKFMEYGEDWKTALAQIKRPASIIKKHRPLSFAYEDNGRLSSPQKAAPQSGTLSVVFMVGTAGIEPVTSRMWTVRSDQLSYAPLSAIKILYADRRFVV